MALDRWIYERSMVEITSEDRNRIGRRVASFGNCDCDRAKMQEPLD